MSEDRVLCLGEALIDVVIRGDSRVEHVGGSLLNVAAGLARLGHRASICAWWGDDPRGARLAEAAANADVSVEPGTQGAAATPVAYATLDDEGRATYEFDLTWDVPEVKDLDTVTHLHTGSIAATLEPGGSKVVDLVKAVRQHSTVSYDPNIRPALMGSPEAVMGRVEELVSLSDVVKASDEDLGWLYPDEPVENVMRRWVGLGPSLVVCTRGPWGAYALLRNNRDLLVVDQMNVDLVDTVGAGDSFMAGMISGLLAGGFLGDRDAAAWLARSGWSAVQPALHRAVITSAITVSHAGAYGPTMAEVNAAHEVDPRLL